MRALTIGLAAGLGALAGAAAGHAETQSLRWTTFLRPAPGAQYAVIDEVRVGTTVDVLECREAWCRVRYGDTAGWVERPAIAAAPAAAATGQPVACPEFVHSGWPRDGVAERLCLRPAR